MSKTSFSISPVLNKKLILASERCSIPQEKLLKKAITKFLASVHKSEFIHGTIVKYNSRSKNKHIIKTIRLNPEEYSILMQCRFYMRLSISFIISEAIKNNLDGIVRASIKLKNYFKKPLPIFFTKSITVMKNFHIYWPFIKTNEIPFLAHRWNPCLL